MTFSLLSTKKNALHFQMRISFLLFPFKTKWVRSCPSGEHHNEKEDEHALRASVSFSEVNDPPPLKRKTSPSFSNADKLPFVSFSKQNGSALPRRANIMTRRRRRSVFFLYFVIFSEINDLVPFPQKNGSPSSSNADGPPLASFSKQNDRASIRHFSNSPPPQFATGGELRKMANASVARTPSPNTTPPTRWNGNAHGGRRTITGGRPHSENTYTASMK